MVWLSQRAAASYQTLPFLTCVSPWGLFLQHCFSAYSKEAKCFSTKSSRGRAMSRAKKEKALPLWPLLNPLKHKTVPWKKYKREESPKQTAKLSQVAKPVEVTSNCSCLHILFSEKGKWFSNLHIGTISCLAIRKQLWLMGLMRHPKAAEASQMAPHGYI